MPRTTTLRGTYSHLPGRLVETWSRPDFLYFKFARLGQSALHAHSRTEKTPAGRFTVIDTRYRVPVLRRATGSGALSMEVRQRDIWPEGPVDGRRDGVWQLRVAGLPVSLGGQLHLRPRPPGEAAELTVRVTADARALPLLGPGLEGFATWMVRQTLHKVPAITHDWLARQRDAAREARVRDRPDPYGGPLVDPYGGPPVDPSEGGHRRRT